MSGRTTFYQLINRHDRIEIPIIQRDYAQGRERESDVREDFLRALHDALCLPCDAPGLPLDLDFIYGSVVNSSFQPLDGQQRLTTLFLLHWYLAWTDGQEEDFRANLVNGSRSRFGYEVRPSSRDFMNALASYQPEVLATDCEDVASMITDQPWYFRNWRFDPSIRSALSVLKRMHSLLGQTAGLYARLTDDRAPAITFQLLDLEQFDLSDDLYIKMNARGKPLTRFETFKARFERHLENHFGSERHPFGGEEPLHKFFAHRMDTRWSDFFWPFRDSRTATFDDAVMNLLRSVILVTRDPESDQTTRDINLLRNPAQLSTYSLFHEKDWLDRHMAFALVTLLERWSTGTEDLCCYLPNVRYIDEKAFFQRVITRPTSLTFHELVQLFGYVQFLVHVTGEVDPEDFNSWIRVVSNLTINSDYNRSLDLLRSFAGLRRLVPLMANIVQHLADPDCDVRGFSREQVAEERIKARLLLLGGGWPERIDNAERHPYFRGQIGFLLRFCGINLSKPDEEVTRLDPETAQNAGTLFDHYFVCAARMFTDILGHTKGVGRVWERALLVVGNFLLPFRRNYSLLIPNQDVAWSWKRLLRNAAAGGSQGDVLRNLWDRLGEPSFFERDLSKIIESESEIDNWRRAIVATPTAYDYGQHKMIRFSEEGGTYLLRKSQMNGKHAELFTYCLYRDLKAMADSLSFMVTYYETSSTEEPGVVLAGRLGQDKFEFYLYFEAKAEGYFLYLHEPQAPSDEMLLVLEDEAFEEIDDYWTKVLDRAEMKSAVEDLDRALTQSA